MTNAVGYLGHADLRAIRRAEAIVTVIVCAFWFGVFAIAGAIMAVL